MLISKHTFRIFLIQLLALNFLVAGSTNGQSLEEIYVDIDVKNNTLVEIFNKIESQTNFTFGYNDLVLDNSQKLSLTFKNESLMNVLVEISGKADINFRRINNTISITRRRKFEPKSTPAILDNELQNTISGKVTDENGDPLPGATIIEKGTTNGTATDVDGSYRLTVPDDAVLLISFIGHETQEIPVNNRSVIDATLNLSASSLDEVVVVGYGTQKQKDVTGSIGSVRGEVLNELPVPTFEQALSGRIAGVQVTQGSGAPGASASVRVRGVGTLNNNEPLYVVDGIIMGNVGGGGQDQISPLSLINPNDIESIDVLKDASASAIYGARAGNGVIIITTKRGKGERLNVSYDGYLSHYAMDVSDYGMMNGHEWAQYYSTMQANSGITSYQGQPLVEGVLAGQEFPEYDWLDAILRNGTAQSHNLSVSGGNESSNYYSSVSYFDQTGVLHASDLKRYTLRFNSDHKIKRFTFGNTLLVSRSDGNSTGNVYSGSNSGNWIDRALRTYVHKPIYDPVTGEYAGLDEHPAEAEGLLDNENTHLPYIFNEIPSLASNNRLWASLYGDFEIIDGLTLHTMGSIDYRFTKTEGRKSANTAEGAYFQGPDRTYLSFGFSDSRRWFIENTITYNKSFSKHSINALVGYQAQNDLNKGFSARQDAFENTDYWFFNRPLIMNEITDSDGNVITTIPFSLPNVGNNQSESAIVSVFARVNYNYEDKYLFTATVRRDGSSKFGVNKRWGTFPAFSAGWRLTEESFMPDFTWLHDLKLRVGYGISGSDNVPNYQYASSVGQQGHFNYVFDEGEVSGATINRLANPVLRWEQITMADVGLDVSLFDGRVDLTLDYYDKTTVDMFLPYAPSFEVGMEANPNGNLGEVSNKGFDFSASTINTKGPISWVTDFNFSTVKNKVISLPQGEDRFTNPNITSVGEEIGALYGYVTDGLFQNWDEVYAHAYQNQAVIDINEDGTANYDVNRRDDVTGRSFTAPGDIRYKDLNGDGIIDGDNDRQIIGSTIPDFIWGLSNTLAYKGISLSVFFQGVHGVSLYNGLRIIQERNGTGRKSVNLLNSWNGEGSNNEIPRILNGDPNNNDRASTRWVENGSFVRLKNLRLAYDIPKNIIGKIGLSQWQIYLTATNLLTFTEYSGYDPEIGLLESGGQPDNERAGVDNGTYPITKQYTMGLRIGF